MALSEGSGTMLMKLVMPSSGNNTIAALTAFLQLDERKLR
jgi:hypothetical protein